MWVLFSFSLQTSYSAHLTVKKKIWVQLSPHKLTASVPVPLQIAENLVGFVCPPLCSLWWTPCGQASSGVWDSSSEEAVKAGSLGKDQGQGCRKRVVVTFPTLTMQSKLWTTTTKKHSKTRKKKRPNKTSEHRISDIHIIQQEQWPNTICFLSTC